MSTRFSLALGLAMTFFGLYAPVSGAGHPLDCVTIIGPLRTVPSFFTRPEGRIHLIPQFTQSLRDQCLGTCVLNASTTYIEYLMAAKLGRYVRLSLDHTLAEIWLRQAVYLRESSSKGKVRLIDDAVDEHRFFSVVSEIGVLPEDAWTPKASPAHDAEVSAEIRAKLFQMINEDIEKFGEYESGKLLADFKLKVRQYLIEKIGQPPTSFLFKDLNSGENLTPRQFFSENIRVDLTRRNVRDLLLATRVRSFDHQISRVQKEFNPRPLKQVLDTLDQNAPVLGTIWIQDNRIDNNTGVVSFDFVKESFLESSGAHKVIFVGYELDHNGELFGLFFQNSWGLSGGPIGLFEVTMDYLRAGPWDQTTFDFFKLPAQGID